MGVRNFQINRTYGEHEIIPDLLYDIVPERYCWNKTDKRGRKWVKMARAFMLRTENTPKDRFTQAAHEVGEELGISAEAVKSALRREMFNEDASIMIPREVLICVEKRVKNHDEFAVEDILRVYRENDQE